MGNGSTQKEKPSPQNTVMIQFASASPERVNSHRKTPFRVRRKNLKYLSEGETTRFTSTNSFPWERKFNLIYLSGKAKNKIHVEKLSPVSGENNTSRKLFGSPKRVKYSQKRKFPPSIDSV